MLNIINIYFTNHNNRALLSLDNYYTEQRKVVESMIIQEKANSLMIIITMF